MEGRTIARPDDLVDNLPRILLHPSMEGRTIARPDVGQPAGSSVDTRLLQWRAGQLPGQTACRSWYCNSERDPSMEGRTIARPDL